jgi:glycosyltransferase involved in cell wall biosynthesis
MIPSCSIVIRAYNEERHIGRLLEGVAGQTIKDVQIILVDSGSTDRTLEIASRYPVQVIGIRPQEFSFGRSLNLGIAETRSEVVVLASAHVYPVYPDWLEHLISGFSDVKTALVYGRQSGAPTTHFSEHRIFHHWFPDQSILHQTHPFCNNANAAIRRSLWEHQPYNELLPGLEDLAWARRMFEQGFHIMYSAEAEVVHVHHETWRGVYNRYRREGMAFKTIYPQEHFGFRDFLRLFAVNVLDDWKVAAREKSLGKVWWNVVNFRYNQFLGTWHGYQQSGPLTWQLKQTFYYPRPSLTQKGLRPVQPIQYQETSSEAKYPK